MQRDDMTEPGYYSTDEALFYVTPSGKVFLVGSIDTDTAVWQQHQSLPPQAVPSNLDPGFRAEVEQSRVAHGIP